MHDRATWHNFSAGPTKPTGNPLDVAIDGDAFLVVQTPRGERYTRNGALQINAQGELVTSAGDRVLGDGGPIQFQANDNNITINPDGTITVREGANANSDSARGQAAARPLRPDAVAAEGRSEPVPRARRHRAAAGARERARGARRVEQSNVRGVIEMARMLELTRTYTQIASLLQQAGEMRRNAIERLADVPA